MDSRAGALSQGVCSVCVCPTLFLSKTPFLYRSTANHCIVAVRLSMRCDLPTYVFTSLVLFAAAFTVSLQSFIDSELWHSVKECYGVHTDLDLPDATDQLRFNWHTSIPALGYNRQFPAMSCSGYISAFFTSIETQKLSLLVTIHTHT